MAVVKRNDLSSFLSKLKNATGKDSVNNFAEIVADEGLKIAEQEYSGRNVILKKTKAKNGEISITAEGKGLFYLEYGTGVKGEQSNYQGDLNFDIDFTSAYKIDGKNVRVHLNKWTYYYAYRHTPQLSKTKYEGHEAYAQMFNTAQKLRKLYGSKR